MSATISAKARVRLTIEVVLDGAWGSDCSIGQLHEQAAKEAFDKVVNKLAAEPRSIQWQIVGETKVVGVITERA